MSQLCLYDQTVEFSRVDASTEVCRGIDVCVTQPFMIGVVPIDMRLWKAVLGSRPHSQTEKCTELTYVSWFEAVAFADQVRRLTHMNGLSLPTLGQWLLADAVVDGFKYGRHVS